MVTITMCLLDCDDLAAFYSALRHAKFPHCVIATKGKRFLETIESGVLLLQFTCECKTSNFTAFSGLEHDDCIRDILQIGRSAFTAPYPETVRVSPHASHEVIIGAATNVYCLEDFPDTPHDDATEDASSGAVQKESSTT